MKPPKDAFHRLVRAARTAPPRSITPPFGFETRVLASWRHGPVEEDTAWVLIVMKRAFVAACLVALLSVALSYRYLHDPVQNELTLADSVIKNTLLP